MADLKSLNGCCPTTAGKTERRRDVVPEIYFLTHYNSPLGRYVLAGSERGVVCVATEDEVPARVARWKREGVELRDDDVRNRKLAGQLDEYFAGRLRGFDVSLDLRGTPFQRRVWELLCGIPYGETRTYRQLAEAMGRPKAVRAVGRAIGANPVAIVVPCHRVIGARGELTGYAGGLHRKEALLALESSVSSGAGQ